MSMIDFVHLHVHSDFSLLDGAASVESLAQKAASLGMSHLALTDHGNMFGLPKFQDACSSIPEHPINPIIGSEFYMALGSRHEKSGTENRNKYYHLVLLCTNEQGYRNLMKLSSLSFTEGFYYKPRIDEELLLEYCQGLIALSACMSGEIPSLILEGNEAEAEKRAIWFREAMGADNFYLEIQDHGIPEQKTINSALMGISARTGIPLVATNDIHYIEREDAVAQDILLCIGTNKKRNDEKRMRFHGDQFYFKTGDEMAALFPDCPQAIANTVKIAERCRAEIPKPGPLLPDFDLPPGFSDAGEYLTRQTMEGLERRYPGTTQGAIQERAEYELGVIIKMGFTGYFLIVSDFINWAKEQGIPVGPGRGSGAGSLVAYALRITDIDPLKYRLLFERFMNPDRVSMPDFDVDFCNERRDEVINYVTERYGKDRVGQIITFGTLKAKAVIKDVARALDISLDDSNMIAKLIPEDPKMTLKRAFELESRLREMDKDPKYQELFAIARKLEGKHRHNSFHAAGIVIGKTNLTDFVPLFRDSKTGAIATQYTMDYIEDRGLVKMDFLGLKTLDLIKHSEELIHKRGGSDAAFSVNQIPEEDQAVFKMLGEGKSSGVFQFESEGMQNILKQVKPTSIEDLIALNALYRPGPMDHIPQFIDSKWGKTPIVYPDPSLEGILKETYGVIVYQEQVMQVAQTIAGYSLGQADILRRAMGKKKMDEMVREKAKFIAGATERGYAAATADSIFEILIPFAGYGFNKSHAAAYAILAYQTAYLKANYPVEFMAANLTNEIAGVDKLPEYIEEAKKLGIRIDPPDINRSDRSFTVVDGRIVYGFIGIKGIGEGPAEEIIRRRQESPYSSFMNFLDRVAMKAAEQQESAENGEQAPLSRMVGKKVTELLIKTGAFDQFGMTRATLLKNLDKAVDYAQSKKEDKAFGQTSLFQEADEAGFPEFSFVEYPEMDQTERLAIEKELIGFYFSGHPLDELRDLWERYCVLNLAQMEKALDGEYILIGILKSIKPYMDKKGKPMAFGSLMDYNGEIDLVFFEKVWETCRDALAVESPVILRGQLDTKRDRPSFQVLELLKAEHFYRHTEEIHIRLEERAGTQEEELYPLRDYLLRNPGSCTVYIHVPLPEGETVIKTSTQLEIASDQGHIEGLLHCAGVAEVWKS